MAGESLGSHGFGFLKSAASGEATGEVGELHAVVAVGVFA